MYVHQMLLLVFLSLDYRSTIFMFHALEIEGFRRIRRFQGVSSEIRRVTVYLAWMCITFTFLTLDGSSAISVFDVLKLGGFGDFGDFEFFGTSRSLPRIHTRHTYLYLAHLLFSCSGIKALSLPGFS